jgi:hypothetical protein
MNKLLSPEPRQIRVRHADAHATAGYAPVRLQSLRRIHVRMEAVRASVLAEYCVGFEQEDEHLIELAIDEAATLAWQTGYPELVFPELAVEKARNVAASLG